MLCDLGMPHRPWTSAKKAPKGFVAKFFSSLLSCKRKEIKFVTRRTKAPLDDDSNKVRRRNKHVINFDASQHAKCVGEMAAIESPDKIEPC